MFCEFCGSGPECAVCGRADPMAELANELADALADLFEHCAMVHKHWGSGSNNREADVAIRRARAALAKAKPEHAGAA